MTNQRWRVLFGTINAVCVYLVVQPQVQAYPLLLLGLGAVVAGLGFIRAPEDPAP